MAKMSKEHQWRMEGYVSAFRFAKSYSLDELEADIKKRGFYGIPVGIDKKAIDRFMLQISANLTQTMAAVMLMVLHDELGFRKQRLQKMKRKFDEATDVIFDFSKLGNHYVKLEDYAIFLNEEYNLGLDIERIASCQDTCTYEKENKGMVRIENIIDVLQQNGFKEAAEWLEKQVN